MEGFSTRALRIVDELNKCGITYIAYQPDISSREIYDIISGEKKITLIPVCREGEAFAIAAGLITGGKKAAVAIQNTGLLESGDSICGLIQGFKIPLLILVSYRGWMRDEPMIDSQAIHLEPTLRAWGIKYFLVETDEDTDRISLAFSESQKVSEPIAILLT